MKCRRKHCYDGTPNAGKPMGMVLDIVSIEDHNPVDGPSKQACIAKLSDGSWEFIWNLDIIAQAVSVE